MLMEVVCVKTDWLSICIRYDERVWECECKVGEFPYSQCIIYEVSTMSRYLRY